MFAFTPEAVLGRAQGADLVTMVTPTSRLVSTSVVSSDPSALLGGLAPATGRPEARRISPQTRRYLSQTETRPSRKQLGDVTAGLMWQMAWCQHQAEIRLESVPWGPKLNQSAADLTSSLSRCVWNVPSGINFRLIRVWKFNDTPDRLK